MSIDLRNQHSPDTPENTGSAARPVSADSQPAGTSFAETALRLGGKSAEEARRTGAVDTADEQVEALFAPQYQTTSSPVHRAVWDNQVPVELFRAEPAEADAATVRVMRDSRDVVRRHRNAGILYDEHGKISPQALAELGEAGYWGLLIDPQYGGSGAPFRVFAPFLTRMAIEDPTVAGLASVHGCIGAVDPVRTFGTPEQQQRFLPDLASGRRLSAFALTEPGAGSDLTALTTTARLRGDEYVVNGEKLFITNTGPGRVIGLVCLIERKPAVLIAELPEEPTPTLEFRDYGLYALRHAWNRGMVFRDFRVPAANLLQPVQGDGLTIAYHGLNLGRIALCANAAGTMRTMLAEMVPWARYRQTYGQPIASRELVRRRMGHLAGLIVACDALVEWCSGLIDSGYRGEMECIIAKIFGSEAQKHAAIDLYMKTHGGRSFLVGHPFGDNVHEFLAPCIYEGEGEMLGMAFFKSLVKHHGRRYFEPVGHAMSAAGFNGKGTPGPAALWAARRPLARYAGWMVRDRFTPASHSELPAGMPHALARHARWAAAQLQRSRREISGTLRKHQLRLADRQCRMVEISQRVQNLTVMLCTSLYAARQENELIRDSADGLCRTLRAQLTGTRPTDADIRRQTEIGAAIADGDTTFTSLVEPSAILMPGHVE